MSNNICLTKHFTFLKYVNQHQMFYFLTLFTFAVLFALVWILRKYTTFEKLRIPRASRPKFPYGNFSGVLKGETTLHIFLWKYHNRFKKKIYKYGGLFVFLKPVLLLTDVTVAEELTQEKFLQICPKESKLTKDNVETILRTGALRTFIQKFQYSVNTAIPEKLLNSHTETVIKEFLLESCCLAFGFKSFELLQEINELQQRYQISSKFYLFLTIPFFNRKKRKLCYDLEEYFIDILEDRKKNDSEETDLLEAFINLYNESEIPVAGIAEELFDLFSDILNYSYSAIMFCLYELSNHKEIQDELIGEIRRHNNDKKSSAYDLLKLVYLDAVVKETFRKYPPVASIIKVGRKDTGTLDWYPVKDPVIFQSVLGIQRDSEFYTKPEDFDPDRFSDNQVPKKGVYKPFGDGPASDLRLKVASVQVKLMLHSILSSLRVEFKNDDCTLKYDPKLIYLSPGSDRINLKFLKIQY
ncbi:hypothetical protein ABEB36_007378 [Hypothenemus hampei]|uniref:Cytochrome P450 n=1 Tax=Hypothenemus hampei TaxID=57062 RepID=A0ABD1ETS8_HYPHA